MVAFTKEKFAGKDIICFARNVGNRNQFIINIIGDIKMRFNHITNKEDMQRMAVYTPQTKPLTERAVQRTYLDASVNLGVVMDKTAEALSPHAYQTYLFWLACEEGLPTYEDIVMEWYK